MKIIGYLTAGYPTLAKSVETAKHYVAGGCDMLEISIPLENNREKPFLSEVMKKAIAECSDYDEYLKSIAQIAKDNPNTPITILIYEEVVQMIGADKFVNFCVENNILDVNSANLKDEYAIDLMNKKGVRIAGLVNYGLKDEMIEKSAKATGFCYCQAFPREGQELVKGYETLDKIIPYLRERGIKNEIYCGGGIAKPEDAKVVKAAGADGLFLGTSIITLFDDTDKLESTIKEYCDAVK